MKTYMITGALGAALLALSACGNPSEVDFTEDGAMIEGSAEQNAVIDEPDYDATEYDSAATETTENDTQEFVDMASQANLAALRTSEVAVERASTPEVKEYAQMMVDHHKSAAEGLKTAMAGAVAAFFSTCDSIGSTLSSLLVRDVYARLIVRDREDQHYLRVGQWLTPLIIFGSFGYVPLLIRERGMMLFLIDQVSVFVVPLLTIYLMGIFTRVHRSSGAVGLSVGVAYGVLRLLAPVVAERFAVVVLPPLMVNAYASYVFSILITAGTMIAMSLLLGWEPPGKLLHQEKTGWLRASQLRVSQIEPTGHVSRSPVWPAVLGIAVVVVGVLLSLVIFW